MRVPVLPLIAATGLACLSPLALGQDRAPAGSNPSAAAAQAEPTVANLKVEFKGGTLDAFVKAVREGSKDPVNIVLQGGADQVPVAAMSLVDVSVETALRVALAPRIGTTEVTPDGGASLIHMSTIQSGPQEQPVYVVSRRTQAGHGKPLSVATEVISIQRLLTGVERDGVAPVPEKVILEAIDAGLAISRRDGVLRPEISYHKDSGLLLVHASTADLQLVSDVVKRIHDSYVVRATEAAQTRRLKIERAAERSKLEIQTNLARHRVSIAEARLSQTRKLADQGHAPAHEVSQAELAFAEARAEYDLTLIDQKRMLEEANLGSTEPAAVTPQPDRPPSGQPKDR